MENLSKLSREDLMKLQKELLKELSRRDNEAWDIAANNFKKAYEELMFSGIGELKVGIDVFCEDPGYKITEHIEIVNILIDKENKTIILETGEICI